MIQTYFLFHCSIIIHLEGNYFVFITTNFIRNRKKIQQTSLIYYARWNLNVFWRIVSRHFFSDNTQHFPLSTSDEHITFDLSGFVYTHEIPRPCEPTDKDTRSREKLWQEKVKTGQREITSTEMKRGETKTTAGKRLKNALTLRELPSDIFVLITEPGCPSRLYLIIHLHAFPFWDKCQTHNISDEIPQNTFVAK